MQTLIVDDQISVVRIKLNRPDVHNAFNPLMIQELTDVANELRLREDVRVVVLEGEGPSFSAGADLVWMSSMKNFSFEENLSDSKKLSGMFHALFHLPMPLIGKVQGSALGGGVGLVSVCDIVVCDEKAQIGLTETRLGLVPAVISPFVLDKMGRSWGAMAFLTGEKFSAIKAREMGLVHIIDSASNLENCILETIKKIMMCAPNANRQAKKILRDKHINENDLCALISSLRIGAEGQEGMGSLFNKTKPSWIIK